MEGVREMASFDDFYKSFPKDEVLKWKFFEKEVVPCFLKEDPLFSSWISKVQCVGNVGSVNRPAV